MEAIDELGIILSEIGKNPYIGPVEGIVVTVEPLCISAFSGSAVLKEPKVALLKTLGLHTRGYSAESHFVTNFNTELANDGGDSANDHSHAVKVNHDGTQAGAITIASVLNVGDTVLLLPSRENQRFYIIGVIG
jgi:hypothetical protein